MHSSGMSCFGAGADFGDSIASGCTVFLQETQIKFEIDVSNAETFPNLHLNSRSEFRTATCLHSSGVQSISCVIAPTTLRRSICV